MNAAVNRALTRRYSRAISESSPASLDDGPERTNAIKRFMNSVTSSSAKSESCCRRSARRAARKSLEATNSFSATCVIANANTAHPFARVVVAFVRVCTIVNVASSLIVAETSPTVPRNDRLVAVSTSRQYVSSVVETRSSAPAPDKYSSSSTHRRNDSTSNIVLNDVEPFVAMYSTSGANPTSPRRLPVALRNRARASVRVSSSPTAKLLFNLSIGRNPSSSTASRHALHTNRTSVYALAGAYANARCSKSFDTDAFPRAFPRASRPVVDVVLVLVVPPTANASASDSCLRSD